MSSEETYNYLRLGARIKEVLGERPSRSTLRNAAHDARTRTRTEARPRLTAGMPSPLPRTNPKSPALFSAAEVEAWLAAHPRHAFNAAQDRVRAATSAGEPEAAIVAQARRDGLSWGAIATTLSEATGTHVVRATLHKRYGHQDQDTAGPHAER